MSCAELLAAATGLERESAAIAAELPAILPSPLRRFLGHAVAFERSAGRDPTPLLVHYTEVMPRQRLAQQDEPLLNVALEWEQLPRLTVAIDRLFAVLADAEVDPTAALGAPTAAAFRAATPTISALHARSHYGAAMPMLYAYPADLAYFTSAGRPPLATIDRYLVAPVIHELCHFARDRDALPPHLDECVAGWLGVYVWPEFAYPAPGHDDAIYAAPWLSQVGQAIARAFGISHVIRAHAGVEEWESALPRAFVEAATRLAWGDWRARRTTHFLSDTFDPDPWIALAYAHGVPEDRAFDRRIIEDALRAMCLDNACIAGSFRTRTRLPDMPIELADGIVTTARSSAVDRVPPRYHLPPTVRARRTVQLASLEHIPVVAGEVATGWW